MPGANLKPENAVAQPVKTRRRWTIGLVLLGALLFVLVIALTTIDNLQLEVRLYPGT